MAPTASALARSGASDGDILRALIELLISQRIIRRDELLKGICSEAADVLLEEAVGPAGKKRRG